MEYIEKTILRLAFIKMTLKEEFILLSSKEIDDILKIVFLEQENNGKNIDYLELLESARALCKLSEPKEIKPYNGSSKRINIIKGEDENVIIFKNAFKKMEEDEQNVILESLTCIKDKEAYMNAVTKLVNIIKEEDEDFSDFIEKSLRKNIRNKR